MPSPDPTWDVWQPQMVPRPAVKQDDTCVEKFLQLYTRKFKKQSETSNKFTSGIVNRIQKQAIVLLLWSQVI